MFTIHSISYHLCSSHKQGDSGDYFYVVEKGTVAFHVDSDLPEGATSSTVSDSKNLPNQVGTGSKGNTFGELALLYNTPRAASIRATSPLTVYKIDRVTFQTLSMCNQTVARTDILALVKKQAALQGLDDAQVQKLADALTIMEFDEGERIVNKGDQGNVLYIVKSGKVKLSDIGHGNSRFEDQVLGEGESFGERALIEGETRGRAANVDAVSQPSVLLAISKGVFEKIIGPLEQAMKDSSYTKYLKSVPLMRNLEDEEVARCVHRLKEEKYKKGDKILAKGKLYLIQEGCALMMVNDSSDDPKEAGLGSMLVKLEKGDYFGNIWHGLSEGEENRPTQSGQMDEDRVNIESDMTCLTLETSDIRDIVGNLSRMSTHEDDEEKAHVRRQTVRISDIESADLVKAKKPTRRQDKLSLKMLTKHHILGVGTFGKVWLVSRKEETSTKGQATAYALKMISKRQLLQAKLASAVMREKVRRGLKCPGVNFSRCVSQID